MLEESTIMEIYELLHIHARSGDCISLLRIYVQYPPIVPLQPANVKFTNLVNVSLETSLETSIVKVVGQISIILKDEVFVVSEVFIDYEGVRFTLKEEANSFKKLSNEIKRLRRIVEII